MKSVIFYGVLVLMLVLYVTIGAKAGGIYAARSPMRSKRGTFVDDRIEYGEGTSRLLNRNRKRNHILHPQTKRFRREVENADMYKRGPRANPEERLKRVKKFNPETAE